MIKKTSPTNLYAYAIMLALLFVNVKCTLLKKNNANKKIIYHLCDSVERYMGDFIQNQKNICIVIDNSSYKCVELFPYTDRAALYELEIVPYIRRNGEFNFDKRSKKIAESSNRYLTILNKLYPVYIAGLDDHLAQYLPHHDTNIGRGEVNYHVPTDKIFINLDNCTFYSQKNIKLLRGIRK